MEVFDLPKGINMTKECETAQDISDHALEDAQGGFELFQYYRVDTASPLLRDYELKVDPNTTG